MYVIFSSLNIMFFFLAMINPNPYIYKAKFIGTDINLIKTSYFVIKFYDYIIGQHKYLIHIPEPLYNNRVTSLLLMPDSLHNNESKQGRLL